LVHDFLVLDDDGADADDPLVVVDDDDDDGSSDDPVIDALTRAERSMLTASSIIFFSDVIWYGVDEGSEPRTKPGSCC
jgi:hypothetical protein